MVQSGACVCVCGCGLAPVDAAGLFGLRCFGLQCKKLSTEREVKRRKLSLSPVSMTACLSRSDLGILRPLGHSRPADHL